jgi:predicted anti-sigma-YlaC factor YlaD
MAGHLSAAELLDVVEGVADEHRYPHLATCSACRAQLDEARAALAVVDIVEVPEPSPLFWDHLSARVHEAVAREQSSGGVWRLRWIPWRLVAPVAAAAIVVVAMSVLPQSPRTAPENPPVRTGADVSGGPVDAPIADDASLTFVADLASDLDLDGAAQAGLAVRAGAVDGVLPTLSASETAELQRLLTEALAERPARGGA